MISFKEFEQTILFLKEIDKKVDVVYDFIGFENKISDIYDEYSNQIRKMLYDRFDDDIISDVIDWWIFECGFGVENTCIYEATDDTIIENINTIKALYDYIIDIYEMGVE